MNRRLLVLGLCLLAASSPLAYVNSGKAAPEAPPVAGHFLEVGKTYKFVFMAQSGLGGEPILCKVLQQPRDNWVSCNIRLADKPMKAWVNLTSVSLVLRHSAQDDD